MAEINLPYLWGAQGRNRFYWYYRRNGLLIPIADLARHRLFPEDVGFLDAFWRIHKQFEAEASKVDRKVILGTLGHAIPRFLSDPETKINTSPNTQRQYRSYLNELLDPRREGEESHGHRALARLTPEAIRKLRDERKDQPHTANARLRTISVFLTFVEGRPQEFLLPVGWKNPAFSVKHFRIGDGGYRPWEEYEIDDFYDRWPIARESGP